VGIEEEGKEGFDEDEEEEAGPKEVLYIDLLVIASSATLIAAVRHLLISLQ
jgi:hypothetical protein